MGLREGQRWKEAELLKSLPRRGYLNPMLRTRATEVVDHDHQGLQPKPFSANAKASGS
jgi:hypothetical protein